MKHLKLFVSFAVAAFLFTSCQKEVDFSGGSGGSGGGGGNNSIVGNYNFVGMKVFTRSTVITNASGMEEKGVVTAGYNSKNNVGTVAITSDKLTTTGIAYSVDTVMKADFYIAGVLLTSIDQPFVMDMPATSGSVNYTRINNDSLYFASGFLSGPVGGGGGPAATVPTGVRISWVADTLFMRTVFNQTTTQDIGGQMATVKLEIDQVVKLKKK